MQIFTPTEQDIPALMQLLEETYHLHHDLDDHYYVPWGPSVREKLEDYLREAVAKGEPLALAAKEGKQLMGLILYQAEGGDAFDTHFDHCGVVVEFIVSENSRGQGVGKQLLERVEGYFRAQGIRHLRLSCSTSNPAAHRFYEREGYSSRQQLLCKAL